MAASVFPVIDFSSDELKPGSPTWESVKSEVRKSLQEFGCFHALYDKIPEEVRKKLFDSLPQLFDLPLEDIERNCPDKGLRYVKPTPGIPLLESIGIVGLKVPDMINSFTNMIWPDGNSATFRETMQRYVEPISELDRTIRIMILESLGLEKYKEEHMDSVGFISLFNKYTPPESNGAETTGLQPHTDKGIVTILDQNEISGLEVMTKDNEWFKVNFCRNSFFVLIGDCLHAWTNGRLHQPHHKVTITGNHEIRYTTGFFSSYKSDYVVKAPEELIDEYHPQLYKPFDIYGFHVFFDMGGYKYHSTLKEYCGI